MAITSGTKLGPYEILSPLGAGGMGEVYRAKDTRLDRIVAIKVLPSHLSSNPDLRQRFEREARAVSSLNHPNICTLHDIGHQDGTDYLVMEFIEGETLAARLQKGPLPTTELLQYAIQIADALDKAHRRGIVHRDLKPGNIILTKSAAKLLDFGLAKNSLFGRNESSHTQLPTESQPLTAEGTILGTLPYMAPEQLEGKDADARTDLFSMGAVLYEMATGKRAFQGKSQASLISAIMSSEPPPISQIQPMSPAALEQVVKTCLAKDPEERLQSAHDLMLELRWIAMAGSQAGIAAPVVHRKSYRWLSIAAAALAVGIAIGWILSRKPASAVSTDPVHTAITLPTGTHLSGWGSPLVAFSPDGKKVAFIAEKEGELQNLYIRSLDNPNAVLVPDSQEAEGPFFSPDSQWVGFAVGVSSRSGLKGELKKYSLATGFTQSICDTPDFFGGTWREDNQIIFSGAETEGLQSVHASGGTAQTIVQKPGLYWPQFLPSGRNVLLFDGSVSQLNGNVVVLDLESKSLKDLKLKTTYVRYIPTGHLLVLRLDGSLLAIPFDPERLALKGAPVAIIKNVCISGNAAGVLDVSNNGSLIYTTGYVRGSGRELLNLVRIDRNGQITPLSFSPNTFGRQPSISPDGKHLAVSTWEGKLWFYDLERNTKINFPIGKLFFAEFPKWSPDGKTIAFMASSLEDSLGWNLYTQPADGSGVSQLVTKGTSEKHLECWTPDGKSLIYMEIQKDGSALHVVEFGTGKSPRLLVNNARQAAISPDGKWLGYSSAESGKFEVYVRPFAGPGSRIPISANGGNNPKWSADGKELYYRNGDRFMVVHVTTDPMFHASVPQPLFEAKDIRGFDFLPRTGEFYALQRDPSGIQTQLQLITNWFGELNRLTPTQPK